MTSPGIPVESSLTRRQRNIEMETSLSERMGREERYRLDRIFCSTRNTARRRALVMGNPEALAILRKLERGEEAQ